MITSHFSKLAVGTFSLLVLQFTLPLSFPFQTSDQSGNHIGLIATAAQPIQYTPPKRRGFRRSDGTGTRGPQARVCNKALPVALTALVPTNHIAQTIAARPTFLWYLADKQTVEFRLVEPGVQKPLLVQSIQVTQPGIVQFELPPNSPELKPNQTYRWSIAVVCRPDRSSEDEVIALIQRVPQTADLSQQLATAKTDQNRAQLYAKSGLWYDALAALSKAIADPKNRTAQTDLLSLLDQGGLTKVTAQERKKR
jgi:Domain of Unknown Function (DUF928)